jgi:hypothetical protein
LYRGVAEPAHPAIGLESDGSMMSVRIAFVFLRLDEAPGNIIIPAIKSARSVMSSFNSMRSQSHDRVRQGSSANIDRYRRSWKHSPARDCLHDASD